MDSERVQTSHKLLAGTAMLCAVRQAFMGDSYPAVWQAHTANGVRPFQKPLVGNANLCTVHL